MYPPEAASAVGCVSSTSAFKTALAALRRHAGLAAGCFLVIATMVACVWWRWPRCYASEARLLASPSLAFSTADNPRERAAAVGSPAGSIPHNGADALRALLQDEAVWVRVADRMGDDAIVDAGYAWDWRRFTTPKRSGGAPAALARRALTLQTLQSRLHVTATSDADVLALTYVAETPETAQRMLQRLLDEACAVPDAMHGAANERHPAENPREPSTDLPGSAAAQQLRAYGDAGRALDEDRYAEALDRLQAAEQQGRATGGQLAAASALAAQLKALIEQLSIQQESAPAPRFDFVAAERTRAQLDELQRADERLSRRLTDVHPARISLRRQHDRLEERLRQLEDSPAGAKAAFDVVRQRLELALLGAEMHVAGLQAQAARLATRRAELERQVADFTASRQELPARAPRSGDAAPAEFAAPEAAPVRLRVLQAATKPTRPIAPRQGVWLAAGICLATGCAAFAVALAERRDPSFSRPEQIRRRLGLPVLATVPRVQRNSA